MNRSKKTRKYPASTIPGEKSVENPGLDNIARYIINIKFRKKILVGLDEQDVWRKIRELDTLYAQAYKSQEAKYKALIDERDQLNDALKNECINLRLLNLSRGDENE